VTLPVRADVLGRKRPATASGAKFQPTVGSGRQNALKRKLERFALGARLLPPGCFLAGAY